VRPPLPKPFADTHSHSNVSIPPFSHGKGVNTSIALKSEREKAIEKGESYDAATAFFHEGKPHPGAWMPSQVIDFMTQEIDKGQFYVVCPDNEVDRETDNLRVLWSASDLVEDRPPLSRWHPDFKDKFAAYVHSAKGSK
jgi:hypothetical protein